MKPKLRTAIKTVLQVFLGTIVTYGFVFACAMLSVMI